jgi:L-lactate dehydrogenase complex protein LldG
MADQELPVAKPVPSLITQFTDELNALGGKVIQVTEQDLSTRLVEFLHQRGIESVFTDEVAARFAPDLQRAGIAVVREPTPQVRCGLTGVLAGIADTGSLVIVGGKGRPLTASLLPEIHLALLRVSELLPSLPAALRRPEIREAPAAVLVTGPSRTADIEMTLTIGVHGPGELQVFLIDDLGGG